MTWSRVFSRRLRREVRILYSTQALLLNDATYGALPCLQVSANESHRARIPATLPVAATSLGVPEARATSPRRANEAIESDNNNLMAEQIRGTFHSVRFCITLQQSF